MVRKGMELRGIALGIGTKLNWLKMFLVRNRLNDYKLNPYKNKFKKIKPSNYSLEE